MDMDADEILGRVTGFMSHHAPLVIDITVALAVAIGVWGYYHPISVGGQVDPAGSALFLPCLVAFGAVLVFIVFLLLNGLVRMHRGWMRDNFPRKGN